MNSTRPYVWNCFGQVVDRIPLCADRDTFDTNFHDCVEVLQTAEGLYQGVIVAFA